MRPLLEIDNVSLHYQVKQGAVHALDRVSFAIQPGEALGLVGESGCGKTTVAMAIMQLLPSSANIISGQIRLNGEDLLNKNETDMQKIRWGRISMVFQAAMNSLNPVYRVGDQIIEAMERHLGVMTRAQMRERVAELFDLVGIDPLMIDRYPHEYSGGMRQRAVIAMALSCNPDLIIADEPTTALDVIVQDKILRRLQGIQKQLGMSMIYISHDIGVIAQVSDRVGVMYGGQLVEIGDVYQIFANPRHDYTRSLLASVPSIKGERVNLLPLSVDPPNLLNAPPGSRFHDHRPGQNPRYYSEQPPLVRVGEDHYVATWEAVESYVNGR
jgi:peptide/nickel transport system ATP-binding protein